MLDLQNDRLFYGDLLSPPPGFTLEQAIGTTYSLDLSTLLSIPMALHFSEHPEINLEQGIIPILEAIQRTSRKLAVFCQKGQIKMPESKHKLYTWLEPIVREVNLGPHSSFHPKIWVLRFTSEQEKPRYRCIVTSRNLTYDQSGDLVLSMDGQVSDKGRQKNRKKNKPLVDFLKHLVKGQEEEKYAAFLDDLAITAFTPEWPVEDFEFWPMGIPGYENPLDESLWGQEGVVISPFLSEYALEKVKSSCSNLTLISRQEELQQLPAELLDGISCYHHKSDYVDGHLLADDEAPDESTSRNLSNQDIHAKLYCFKQGWDSHIWLGSANCTSRAFQGKNVEFLIRIQGKNSRIGPKHIVKGLKLEDEDGFFVKYEPQPPLPPNQYEKIEKQLEAIHQQIIAGTITGRVEPAEDGLFTIRVQLGMNGLPWWREEFSVRFCLLFHEQQTLALSGNGEQELIARNVKETELTQWLLVTIVHSELEREKRFATKVELANLPAGRDEKILGEFINSPDKFFQYIRFLLADNYWDAFGEMEKAMDAKGSSFDRKGYSDEDYPLLESMMYSLAHNPETLKNLEYFIDTLKRNERFREVIPEQFLSLWDTFQNVSNGQKRKSK